MNRLWDVEVTGVHLVDSPANQRRFALVKAQGGPATVHCPNGNCDYSGPMTDDGDCPDCGKSLKSTKSAEPPMKLKLADLKKALEGHTGDEIDAAPFLKALGIELPAPKTDPAPTPIDKSKLPPEVAAHLTAMEQLVTKTAGQVEALVTAAATRETTDLRKRAQALQDAGVEIDVEKATGVEIAAFENVWGQVSKSLEKVGIFKALGDPSRPTEPSATPLKDMVSKAVREQLGREPISKEEEIRTRIAIYKGRPGLQLAVVREERTARAS
jgi:hypothetical protein